MTAEPVHTTQADEEEEDREAKLDGLGEKEAAEEEEESGRAKEYEGGQYEETAVDMVGIDGDVVEKEGAMAVQREVGSGVEVALTEDKEEVDENE